MIKTIFCQLRKKHVVLTPEESVRQQFISWLINSKTFPAGLMAAEYSINYNNKKYRCDIVVFDKTLAPQLIVECKAPNIKLDSTVLEQVIRYNMVLNVKYLIITNGVSTFVCKLGTGNKGYEFVTEIPSYNQLINNIQQ